MKKVNYFRYVIKIFQQHKEYLKFATYALLLFVILGLIFKNSFLEQQNQLIQSILAQLEGKGFFETWMFIFFHNFWANLLIIILGFTLIYPFFSIIVNGFLIGAILARSIVEKGFFTSIALLIPHGIFEIPAILLSLALAFRIALSFKKGKQKWYKRYYLNYKEAAIIFLKIIIPLLLIASFIETLLSTEINLIF